MPVFPSQNLDSQKICESYPKLLQIYNNNLVLDGTGSLKQFLNVTSSYALNCNCGSGNNGYGYIRYWYDLSISEPPYSRLSENPTVTSQQTVTLYVSASASQSIATFLTPLNVPDQTSIPAGVWSAYLHSYSNQFGYLYIRTDIYKRDVSGTETYLLSTDYTPITGVNEYSMDISDGFSGPISINSTDRLVARINVLNTLDSDQIVSFATQGSVHYSFLETPIVKPLFITGSTYPITASWSINTVSASYAPCNCPIMQTGSTYPITASWALNTITASYVVSNPIKRVYSNYTLTDVDYTILCDATSGSFDVKLPSATSASTRLFNIKKIDKSGHAINVITQANNYIDYDVTQSITHRGTNMSVQSDGTQYWIL